MRTSKPITVSLGKQQKVLDTLLASGDYDTASEALRAGLRALEREREMIDEVMRAKIQEAIDDPRPSIPANDVFRDLRVLHAEQPKTRKRGV
ncbi:MULTISPECIES: type II toxin-antitoxin system ParD family antitoxin [unclassified Rhizobium]|uniref:type II toxin-antitoxin system ParD family antitoxin n=1 Tax=unclassified Rhizobium TaxID=2613769 RepID=UPI00104AB1B7|nr:MULTISPECIES: type II toxin-antitoxin system ParD family antitoxin [unclassified Rhizobium]MBB3393729.1 antitoxin ParD1/3/4 [Rhizobium sp. BK060]MBB4166452.1 antitoxin ParD1/3/4 [Rhizobium sp. BK538]TCM81672.1 antitoxin ParD1/3/4 [Rhizobium sp. BK068]